VGSVEFIAATLRARDRVAGHEGTGRICSQSPRRPGPAARVLDAWIDGRPRHPVLGMHEFPTAFAGGLAMCPAGLNCSIIFQPWVRRRK